MTMNLLAIKGWLQSKHTNLTLAYTNNNSQHVKVRNKN